MGVRGAYGYILGAVFQIKRAACREAALEEIDRLTELSNHFRFLSDDEIIFVIRELVLERFEAESMEQ